MSDKKQAGRSPRPERVTLSIHDLNNLGCGVGRMPGEGAEAGLVLFVKGAVTGDVVEEIGRAHV